MPTPAPDAPATRPAGSGPTARPQSAGREPAHPQPPGPTPPRGPGRPPAPPTPGSRPLLRTSLGGVLRRERLDQGRTLAGVARSARVSMQYLSEIERGRKEASSEVLDSVCDALHLDLSDVLTEVAGELGARRGTPRASVAASGRIRFATAPVRHAAGRVRVAATAPASRVPSAYCLVA